MIKRHRRIAQTLGFLFVLLLTLRAPLWSVRPPSSPLDIPPAVSSDTVPFSEACPSAPSSEALLPDFSSEEHPSAPSSTASSAFPQMSGESVRPPISTVPNVAPVPSPAHSSLIVGYYPSWASAEGYRPSDVNASLLTHLHYAFADVSATGELSLPNGTVDLQNLAELRALRQRNPHLKVLISIGGWDYSDHFSAVAATLLGRERFAQSCVEFLTTHQLDGIDLDWEFPQAADRESFTLLLQTLRQALGQQSAQDGRSYLLTLAGSADPSYLHCIEPQKIAAWVDYIFVMGYDLHGSWDSFADLNAPLAPARDETPQYTNSLTQTLDAYARVGIPAAKLVLGMPFYGYQYATDGENGTGLYRPFSAAQSIDFDEIKNRILPDPSFTRYFHENAQVPYLSDGETFISYDDEISIAAKASLARARGLAGIGAWNLSQDSDGTLLSHAYRAWHG